MQQNEPSARRSSHRGPVLLFAVTAAIAILLLLPCILAASGHTVFPRTTVAGIDVSGLSRQEACEKLSAELPSLYADAILEIDVDRSASQAGDVVSFALPLDPLYAAPDQASVEQLAAQAYETGRTGNFFTEGVSYVRSLLFGNPIEPEFSLNEEAAATAVEQLAEKVNLPVVECTWRIDKDSLYITKPRNGYLLDNAALLKDLHTAVSQYDLTKISCSLTEKAPAAVTVDELYQDAHSAASNAYYDKASGTVKDGKIGIDFTPAEAQQLMDKAAAGEEFSVPVEIIRPKITKEEMQSKLFRDQLGECTTYVKGTANRKHNVGLATKSCNGIVLNPGEVFSYNATLGQRTHANGYRDAAAYSNGKTVQTPGGGICQVSSTIYLAALRSDLEIVARSNHSFYTGYIPYGMDATVSWGNPDLKIRNNKEYPIRLNLRYTNNNLTCSISGTNLTGNTVKIEYSVLGTTPYKVVEKPDPTLPAGVRKQEQNGYTGYKVVTYRCIYDKNGKLLSRNQEARSTYQARDQIIRVGPAPVTPPDEAPPSSETPAEQSAPPATDTTSFATR